MGNRRDFICSDQRNTGLARRRAANDWGATPVEWLGRPHALLPSSSRTCPSLAPTQHRANRSLTGTGRSQDGGGRWRRFALPHRGAHRRAPQRGCSGSEATGDLGKREGGPGGTSGPRGEKSPFAGSGGRGRRPISIHLSSPRVPDSMIRRPGLGVGPPGGGSEAEDPGPAKCARRPRAWEAAVRERASGLG